MSRPCFNETDWPAAPAPRLATDAVHVWAIALDDTRLPLDALAATLNGAERARAARFKFAPDREAFVASHGALRSILSGYLGLTPQEIAFAESAHGKPEIVGIGAGTVCFNLSHTRGAALVAVTGGARVGVDVERIREDTPILDLARRFFHPDEARALAQMPAYHRLDAFFTTWTRKEALVKAHGDGLGHLLQAFAVSVGREAEVLIRPASEDEVEWRVWDLPVLTGYRAAVAADQTMMLVRRLWRFTS